MKGLALLFAFCCASVVFAQTQNEKQLFSYVNSERTREGLRPLEWDDQLYDVALAHSRDMASKNALSHFGTDGSDPEIRVSHARIFASEVAENVARDLNIVSTHTSLMSSFYHRENIMNPQFDRIGIGIVRKAEYLYITELFIAAVPDLAPDEARRMLLQSIDHFRSVKNLPAVNVLDELNDAAQLSSAEKVREDSLSAGVAVPGLAAQLHAALHINIYTCSNLNSVPAQLKHLFSQPELTVGVGIQRARGKLCDSGCYVVAVISE